jgi:hypothetical protein
VTSRRFDDVGEAARFLALYMGVGSETHVYRRLRGQVPGYVDTRRLSYDEMEALVRRAARMILRGAR